MALTKSKKKHYVGLTWATGNIKGGLAMSATRTTIGAFSLDLRASQAKKAVDTDGMNVKNLRLVVTYSSSWKTAASIPIRDRVKHMISCVNPSMCLLAVLLTCGCGSGGPQPISVILSPSSAQTIDQGQTLNVTATVTNDLSGDGVTWSLTGPGILTMVTTTSVTYNATQSGPGAQRATIVATSVANSASSASLVLAINLALTITTNSLSSGTVGSAYSQTLTGSGGTPPYTWSIAAGGIPNGLSLDATSASIIGTPTGGGTWYFTPKLSDAAGYSVRGIVVNGIGGYPLSIAVQASIPPGNPIPFISKPLVPDAISPGGPSFTLTVNGTGFVSGATVLFNGVSLPTTFVSNRQLSATVSASNIASASSASITVVNSTPGGGTSNLVYLPVASPETTVSFTSATGSPIPVAANYVVAQDFNADGKTDLAVASPPVVAVLSGNGNGTFTQATGSLIDLPPSPFGSFPPDPASILIGDFNNSGKPGLGVLDSVNDVVYILFGNGDGTFTLSAAPVNTQGCSAAFGAGDFTGDGNLDLVALNHCGVSFAFLRGYGDGAFTYLPVPPPPITGTPDSVAVGDFNEDGKLDLVFTSDFPGLGSLDNTVLNVTLGNGNGTFAQASGSPMTIGTVIPGPICVADFNGDGKLDVAVATTPSLNGGSSPGSLYIFLGNGDGTFTMAPGSPISVGIEPKSIALGDLNADGKVDLAVANFGSNSVSVLLGNGDGTFIEATGSPFPVGSGPVSLVAGDFNGSGRLGLAVANSNDRTITILVQH